MEILNTEKVLEIIKAKKELKEKAQEIYSRYRDDVQSEFVEFGKALDKDLNVFRMTCTSEIPVQLVIESVDNEYEEEDYPHKMFISLEINMIDKPLKNPSDLDLELMRLADYFALKRRPLSINDKKYLSHHYEVHGDFVLHSWGDTAREDNPLKFSQFSDVVKEIEKWLVKVYPLNMEIREKLGGENE